MVRFNSFKDDFLNACSSKSWQSRTALGRGREDICMHFSVGCLHKDQEIGLIPSSPAKDHWIRCFLCWQNGKKIVALKLTST